MKVLPNGKRLNLNIFSQNISLFFDLKNMVFSKNLKISKKNFERVRVYSFT